MERHVILPVVAETLADAYKAARSEPFTVLETPAEVIHAVTLDIAERLAVACAEAGIPFDAVRWLNVANPDWIS